MRRLIPYLILALLSACGGKQGEVLLRGHYANLRQTDFFLYSLDDGATAIDTIHVRDGRFEHRLSLDGEATYHIVYPNMAELTVFAHSGDVIDIEGDASNLREVQVEGNDDNERYTALRMAMNEAPNDEVRDSLMHDCIDTHTGTLLARYLLLYLHDRGPLASTIRVGARLPSFAPTDSLRGHPLVMAFYAHWMSDRNSPVFRTMREALRADDSLRVVTYGLDIDPDEHRRLLRRDSVLTDKYRRRWTDTCDYRGLQSPLVARWRIDDYPYYIRVDRQGRITACGTNWEEVKNAK